MLSPFFKLVNVFVDGMEINKEIKYPKIFIKTFNFITPLIRLFLGKRAAGAVIRFDDYLSNNTQHYKGMSFIILKDENCYAEEPQKKVSVLQVIDYKVPFHYLKK
jgi:hypothetical protein